VLPVQAQQPSRGPVAEGEDGNRSDGFLVVDHDGIFEGALAKFFHGAR